MSATAQPCRCSSVEREAKIAKRRKELAASRSECTKERCKAIHGHIDHVKNLVAAESK